jgi:D-proline reductase (dithiol) PrdB
MGCAKDIVEHCGVPRFVFSDFPLGNSAGRPFDVDSQSRTLELALRALESAPGPRTTVQSPQRWNDDAKWKLDYLDLAKLTPEKIEERRKEFDVVKSVAKSKREDAGA